MKLGEGRRPIAEFDLFADEEVIEVLKDLLRLSGVRVEQESVAALRGQPVDQRTGHDTGLGGAEERLAAAANGEIADIIRTEVVQESASLRAGHRDLAAIGNVEQSGPGASLLVPGHERLSSVFASR